VRSEVWRAAPLAIGLLALLISGCQPPTSERADTVPAPQADPHAGSGTESGWPAFDYHGSAAAGHPIYRLDSAGSTLDVVVRRDGPLARFGHDHVVSVPELEGYLLLEATGTGSRGDLAFRLEDLAIDTPDARSRHQLDTTPDEKAIEGTRANLMEKVLNAQRWPLVTVRLDHFSGQGNQFSAAVRITVDGSQSESRQPFRLDATDEGVRVEGSVVVKQTELGLEPFSTLGGGLRVADPLEIHFSLRGTPLTGR
jgi:hypothetical protein